MAVRTADGTHEVDRAPGRTAHARHRPSACYRWSLAEPPRSRTGDPPFGANRGSTAAATPTPSPTAHLAGRAGCFEVRRVPAIIPVSSRDHARSGATSPWTCSSRSASGVTHGPRHLAAADDRPARRPRAHRSGRARRGAVRGQPARRLRRPLRAAHARGSSASSAALGAASLRRDPRLPDRRP